MRQKIDLQQGPEGFEDPKNTIPVSMDCTGKKIAIVAGRFNQYITKRLLSGVQLAMQTLDFNESDLILSWVPGAYEMPIAAKKFATNTDIDAIICLGAVIRGDTPHFDYVAGEAARGIMSVALETGTPVIFGVLTTDTVEQALVRSEDNETNKGYEAFFTAIEMANLISSI